MGGMIIANKSGKTVSGFEFRVSSSAFIGGHQLTRNPKLETQTMISIRPFIAADVPLGMRLKAQAGWNQTEADWRRMQGMQPDGCFVAELGGIAAGTVMTCIFGDVAWIA